MVRFSNGTKSSSPPASPDFTGRFPSSMNGEDSKLFEQLAALHADEFAYLHRRLKGRLAEWEKSWWHRGLDIVYQYFLFVVETWFQCIWANVFFPLTLMDRISLIAMSTLSTFAMAFALCWCTLCLFPSVVHLASAASRYIFDGVDIVNAAYPKIFTDLKQDVVKAAHEHLSDPRKKSTFSECRKTRMFNLDVAKLLLQCAALMYERTSKEVQTAALLADKHKVSPARLEHSNLIDGLPGSRIRRACGEIGAALVNAELNEMNVGEVTIREAAMRDLGLQYQSVSELNTLGSSLCGLFWDPVDSFIIVAFRGTSPTDFMEWRTDFTFRMREANQWLNGFWRVHDGFMDKIFPRKIPADCLNPFDTIVEAVQLVAARLMQKKNSDTKINVWITGHSLGCALASLAYARMVSDLEEIGPNVCVRDAYLFAAPILCDVMSAGAFNNRMHHYMTDQKTLWRVTNGRDIVATGLPHMGDHPQWPISPWNILSFAHLGSEIKMRAAPNRCIVAGDLISSGTTVKIESAFDVDALNQDTSAKQRALRRIQNLPIIGRFIAHAPGFYWASLMDVGVGLCDWEEEL